MEAAVRIIPPFIEFKDTEVDRVYTMRMTVKNASSTSKEIRYWPPQSENFTLKVNNPKKAVPPGLEVPAVIEYRTEKEGAERTDRLVITVDGKVVEVPLIASYSRPDMSIDSLVDFGTTVGKSKVITRQLNVYNKGARKGEFKIKYGGRLPITLRPSEGVVAPYSFETIQVESVVTAPGDYEDFASIRLTGQPHGQLRIIGKVVVGSLELLTNQEPGKKVKCVDFGTNYFGTDKFESAMLFNNCPEPVCFVAVLNEGAAGEESNKDLTGLSVEPDRGAGQVNDLHSLLTVIPNQGLLAPYQKIPIFFRFSPRWITSTKGFECIQIPPPRRDFALFVHLRAVGSNEGFLSSLQTDESNKGNESETTASTLEVAVRAIALPVLIALKPKYHDFGQCLVGERVDTVVTLTNESPTMSAFYQFRRLAHVAISPHRGKIQAGKTLRVKASFAPKHIGTFDGIQFLDVTGQVADQDDPFQLRHQIIHSVPLQLVGTTDSVTVVKKPVFNLGLTPIITNEVGLYIDNFQQNPVKKPRVAMLQSSGTNLHKVFKDDPGKIQKVIVAFPNDRSASIKPSERGKDYRTIFTNVKRYTYIDPDYAFTEGEEEEIAKHKSKYDDFLRDLREKNEQRRLTKEYMVTNNEMDIGLQPAAGLRPKKLTLEDIEKEGALEKPKNSTESSPLGVLLSTKQLANSEDMSSKTLSEGANALPTTAKKKKVPTATLR